MSLIQTNGFMKKNVLIPFELTQSILQFVSSPLCCPSRSAIMSGKYSHNNGVGNNEPVFGCGTEIWRQEQDPKAFAPKLQNQGYKTFFMGKYLNQVST